MSKPYKKSVSEKLKEAKTIAPPVPDLKSFKKSKNLNQNVKFKSQEWLPLSDAFNEILSLPGIPKGHVTLFRGHSDTGKAQPLSSKILTPNGWVLMGDITPGMTIMGRDGNTQQILQVFPQGIRPVYKMSFNDGSHVYCDEEHLWAVNKYTKRHSHTKKRNAEGKRPYFSDTSFEVVSTKNLMTRLKVKCGEYDVNNYMIPSADPMNFVEESNLPIDPYVLGLILGDGSISECVTIHTMDMELVDAVAETSHFRRHSKINNRNGNKINLINITKETRDILYELDLRKDSYNKFIPKEFIYDATVEDRLKLLQGLIDTDGYVNKMGTIEYSTSSERLKNDVVELVNSLGGLTKVRSKIPTYHYKDEKRKGALSYTITIRISEQLKICLLERKYSRLTVNRKQIRRYITGIEYSHEEECQCILVSNPDHLYVTDNYIVTHNTSALLETAVSAQKAGDVPVFIITEMKWSWEHAIQMGLNVDKIIDEETGEVTYEGSFIYVDRSSLQTIEDVAAFIADLLHEQKQGRLPYNLVFLWDSIGSIPCRQSVESKKNNNEWNAGAMATQFGNFINQQIIISRKESYPFINTFAAINRVWVEKGLSQYDLPKMKNRGGNTMYSDATIVVTFGNVTNAGTSKIRATRNNKEVEWAKRVNVSVDKNHINGITTKGKIITTPHGFIQEKEIEKYKKTHSHEWATILGSADFDVVEEAEMKEDPRDILESISDE